MPGASGVLIGGSRTGVVHCDVDPFLFFEKDEIGKAGEDVARESEFRPLMLAGRAQKLVAKAVDCVLADVAVTTVHSAQIGVVSPPLPHCDAKEWQQLCGFTQMVKGAASVNARLGRCGFRGLGQTYLGRGSGAEAQGMLTKVW